MTTVARAARWYIEEMGWVLAPIPPGSKGPTTPGWNTPARWLDTVEKVEAHYAGHPHDGTGVIHAPSDTNALDVDDHDRAAAVFAAHGLDLDAVLASGRCWQSARGVKAIWRLPPGVALRLHQHRVDGHSAFELRAGAVQDVLPPSLHPTGVRYRWLPSPLAPGVVPMLPDALLRFWQRLSEPPPLPAPAATVPAPAPRYHGSSIIDAFNAAFSAVELLQRLGYAAPRRGRGRLIAPQSASREPGVVLLDSGRVYSHHGTDPLADGHAHSAFDVLCTLYHGGDLHAALRDAATRLAR